MHDEATNIRLRQLVRDRPDNPTPIEIERYDWVRYKSLPTLKTNGVGAPKEEALITETDRFQWYLQSRNHKTFVFSTDRLVAGGNAIPIGPLTGTYNLNYIRIEIQGEGIPRINWQLWQVNEFTWSQAVAFNGYRLLPEPSGGGFGGAIIQSLAAVEYTHLELIRTYSDDYVNMLVTRLDAGADTDHIIWTLTFTEL